MIAESLSHYTIVEKLGEGGMGAVYRAIDTNLDRPVAIKLLNAGAVADPARKHRFIQEARAASALNHPGIITIYEIGEAEGADFIAMEYVRGRTLSDVIEPAGLDLETALKYALQIAEALAAAHAGGIIHRDLKPANVMVTEQGLVKVLDFGLAKLAQMDQGPSAMTQSVHRTEAGILLGTILYMSPEQAQGLAVDVRSDIFSLGVLLYEMLTGELPFKGPNSISTLFAVVNTPAPRLGRDVPQPLHDILNRALEKDRDRRYQSMAEMAADLRALQRQSDSGVSRMGAPAAAPAIAVLPFTNMSADPENEYLSDGLTEDIITALSQVEGLRVVARTSAFQFKGRANDIRDVGRQLNVGAVLEGSVRRGGNRLRITAQLINVADGFHLWSERFDREARDIFDVQDEISLAIVDKLKIKFARSQCNLANRCTANVDAYNLYLKGGFHLKKMTAEAMGKAMECFEQAIALDPYCAPAYTGIADAWWCLAFWGVRAPREVIGPAKAAAQKALEIDDSFADGHLSLSKIRLYDWDLAGALQEATRALQLNPGSSMAHFCHGNVLGQMGRVTEGRAELFRALELDPLSLNIGTNIGWSWYVGREYEKCIDQCRRTLEMEPGFHLAQMVMALGLRQTGRFDQAIELLRKALDISGGSPFVLGGLGYCYGACGKKDEALGVLETLKQQAAAHYVSADAFCLIHLGLGDYEAAVDWLEKRYEEGDARLMWVKVDPLYDPLRANPRFSGLLQRMGL